jgi:hypothetical protein
VTVVAGAVVGVDSGSRTVIENVSRSTSPSWPMVVHRTSYSPGPRGSSNWKTSWSGSEVGIVASAMFPPDWSCSSA